jgi:hypothetical protein
MMRPPQGQAKIGLLPGRGLELIEAPRHLEVPTAVTAEGVPQGTYLALPAPVSRDVRDEHVAAQQSDDLALHICEARPEQVPHDPLAT